MLNHIRVSVWLYYTKEILFDDYKCEKILPYSTARYRKSSCLAEIFSVSLIITSVKGFERWKVIYLSHIVKTLLKKFATKVFRGIVHQIYLIEVFSHPFSFFVLEIRYYTLFKRWFLMTNNVICFCLPDISRRNDFFLVI